MLYKRLSAQKVNKILLCFSEDITVTATAKLVKVNRKTVNNYYNISNRDIVVPLNKTDEGMYNKRYGIG